MNPIVPINPPIVPINPKNAIQFNHFSLELYLTGVFQSYPWLIPQIKTVILNHIRQSAINWISESLFDHQLCSEEPKISHAWAEVRYWNKTQLCSDGWYKKKKKTDGWFILCYTLSYTPYPTDPWHQVVRIWTWRAAEPCGAWERNLPAKKWLKQHPNMPRRYEDNMEQPIKWHRSLNVFFS